MLAANGWASGVVTRAGLDWLTERMIKAGSADQLRLEGLKDDRRPVIGGGVSVLRAIFDLFGIEQMVPAQGALRHGALYDLIDRDTDGGDVRERTVRWLAHRFSADDVQAQRVSEVSTALFAQIAALDAQNERYSQKLAWAARLHEIGTHISHERSHHHGAYILDNMDAPGFSLPELHRMSQLVMGQRGKLRKLEDALMDELFAKQLMALRLAVLLCHARQMPEYQSVKLSYKSRAFKLSTNPGWAKRYPQSAWLLGKRWWPGRSRPGSSRRTSGSAHTVTQLSLFRGRRETVYTVYTPAPFVIPECIHGQSEQQNQPQETQAGARQLHHPQDRVRRHRPAQDPCDRTGLQRQEANCCALG